ncbi:ArsR/SmtB family transcription factor [Piscinibacter sakaiensis]|uniref:ArsR/SmtB family transcription factor n=1 Tax=Piscinibacter sakaiensis TaxID=1547922 RepID=UPI003AB02F2A
MDSLSTTFAALADPTRRAILGRLAAGDATVGELAQPFTISAPAVSRHLRVLEQAGLISRQVDAQWRLCSLQALPLRDAHDWLDGYRNFWEVSLDRLVDLVEHDGRPAAADTTRARRSMQTRTTTNPPRSRRRSSNK